MATATECLTWPEMVELEPQLAAVETWAREHAGADDAEFWRRYEQLKARMRPLVGWHAVRAEMQCSRAWEAAHRHLYAILAGEAV